MAESTSQAIDAIRAWARLDRAFEAFNADLAAHHGVTGSQLAILRIIAEDESVTLRDLRARLVMHPATIGQLVDRVVRRGLLTRRAAATDARRRVLELTPRGRSLLRRAPLAGPVRLRTARADQRRLRRLAEAFADAVILFGLEEWAT